MKKTKILICESFKIRDYMFKKFLGDAVKPGFMYKAIEEGEGYYLVVNHNGAENMIYLPYLDQDVKDPRYVCRFKELTLDWIIENGLPDHTMPVGELQDWFDAEVEEDEDQNGEYDYDEEEDLVADSFAKIKAVSPDLSTGVLEALSGVISLDMGQLIEQEKEQLIRALKQVVQEYESEGGEESLFIAQYLLFNMINLAKNKW